MGRRKSKRKPPPKKKLTGNLDTQFTCPFCNHEKSCDVKMERTRNTGIISCTVCLEEFQTPITYLSEPVDVYSDWIDACEAANQQPRLTGAEDLTLEQEADLEVALVCFSPITASLQPKMMVPFQADYIADVALRQPIAACHVINCSQASYCYVMWLADM